MLCETMKIRTVGCDCAYCTDTGILQDGERLRVNMTFRDGAGGGGAVRFMDGAPVAWADAMAAADAAHVKSVADLNAWRGQGYAVADAPMPGAHPMVRDSQKVSASDLAAMQDRADAARLASVEDLNAWRAA